MAASWKFSVRKEARGMDGKWFAFPTAQTFVLETDACEYAKEWAEQQTAAGVGGARVVVLRRSARRAFAVYRIGTTV